MDRKPAIRYTPRKSLSGKLDVTRCIRSSLAPHRAALVMPWNLIGNHVAHIGLLKAISSLALTRHPCAALASLLLIP
jgi:hypothetical protein